MGIKQFIYTIVQNAVSEVITREVSVRIDNVEKTLTQRIDHLESRIDSRMDRVELRMDRIELRMDRLESHLEGFEARFDNIEKSLANIQGNLEGEARFFHLADYLKKATQ